MLTLLSIDWLLKFFLLFSRLCGSIITMPILGDKFVNSRLKVALSILLSIIILPLIEKKLPLVNNDNLYIFILISEFIYGVFIGLIARFFFDSLNVAGTIISAGSGLSSVLLFDPSFNSQSTIETRFFTYIIITLFLVCNLHYLFLEAFIHSYNFFKPGEYIFNSDLTEVITKLISTSFIIGVKLAVPNMVAAFTSATVMGILARLMPQIQIFMVNLPVQILVSFILLYIVLVPCLSWYMENYANFLNNLFN